MKNLTVHKQGKKWRLYLNCKSVKEAEATFNALYNRGAVSRYTEIGETCWMCWTTPEKMLKYFTDIRFFTILESEPLKFKGKKGGALTLARELGQKDLDELPEESLPYEDGEESNYFYKSHSPKDKEFNDLKDFFLYRAFQPR
jgi:hypothetical protein